MRKKIRGCICLWLRKHVCPNVWERIGMEKGWLHRRVLSSFYISNWEFWSDTQPPWLTSYPWLDAWSWKQLMPGGYKRKLISFTLPPHLFGAWGKRDKKTYVTASNDHCFSFLCKAVCGYCHWKHQNLSKTRLYTQKINVNHRLEPSQNAFILPYFK